MSAILSSNRESTSQHVERDQYEFRVNPTDAYSTPLPSTSTHKRVPFNADLIRVMCLVTDGNPELIFNVWGQSADGKAGTRGNSWRTTSDNTMGVHFKTAPEWVHTFIRENTTFGEHLDDAMQNA